MLIELTCNNGAEGSIHIVDQEIIYDDGRFLQYLLINPGNKRWQLAVDTGQTEASYYFS